MKGKAKRLAEARRKAQKAAKEQSDYERYLYFTKKYKLDESQVMDESNYISAIAGSKRLSRNKTWRVWTPETLAQSQSRDQLTQREFDALYRAAKKDNPELTKSAFDKKRGYREMIAQRDELNEKLKIEGFDAYERAAIIRLQIYRSE